MAEVAEVAAWLHAEFARRDGELAITVAVAGVRARFGAEFAPGGRLRKDVLVAFGELGAGERVWIPGRRGWRRRNRHDPPGRGSAG